ncbi:MAG: response regulator transcription factor [Methanomassiliicoccus sp.]|nr:response regulator transcription factor [Methanomassiliicoccus sp.]
MEVINKRPARVLVADEPSIQEVTCEMLRAFGMEVGSASTGRELIEACRRAIADDRRFDVVIIGVSVPLALGGGKEIAELLAVDPVARIIVTSVLPEEVLLFGHDDHGIARVLMKPYRTQDLIRAVRAALEAPASGRFVARPEKGYYIP